MKQKGAMNMEMKITILLLVCIFMLGCEVLTEVAPEGQTYDYACAEKAEKLFFD